MTRRYAILASGYFRESRAKTAHGVIAYARDETVAVIDPSCSGMRIRDAVPYLHHDAPIVANIEAALAYHPTALLIGTAPVGGALPSDWRRTILRAIEAKLEIVSGLHDMLADDPEFAHAARASGTTIWDVRRAPEVPIFSGDAWAIEQPILLAVGNDCAVGKMTTMLELAGAAERAGVRAEFVPTGQTGMMIAGWGIAIDRVIADFAPGACEALVLEAARRNPAYLLVEGQGAINHPAYAPVTLALLYGSAPDALLLVADPSERAIHPYRTPVLDYRALIRSYESLCATVKPAEVVAIALNTRGMSDEQARAAIADAHAQTGLPVDDVVRFGADSLWDSIRRSLRKRAPLQAIR